MKRTRGGRWALRRGKCKGQRLEDLLPRGFENGTPVTWALVVISPIKHYSSCCLVYIISVYTLLSGLSSQTEPLDLQGCVFPAFQRPTGFLPSPLRKLLTMLSVKDAGDCLQHPYCSAMDFFAVSGLNLEA